MDSLKINLMFTAFAFVSVLAHAYIRRRKLGQALGLALGAVLFMQIFTGIPIDALASVRRMEEGNRLRGFLYLQTARVMGVPTALNEYVVEPSE